MSAVLTNTARLHAAHLLNAVNYANHNCNGDDEGFKSRISSSKPGALKRHGWGRLAHDGEPLCVQIR